MSVGGRRDVDVHGSGLGSAQVHQHRLPRPRAGDRNLALDDLAARLSDRFETRVKVALGRSKGRLTIEFASVQDLNPFAVRQIDPSAAQKLNAAMPLASGPNPAAASFVLKTDAKTYGRALECLTQAIYYEAARESEEGQRAVAQRMRPVTTVPAGAAISRSPMGSRGRRNGQRVQRGISETAAPAMAR